MRSWFEGKPAIRFGLLIVCIDLALLVVFTGVIMFLTSSSKEEQADLVSRYPDEEARTADVIEREEAVNPSPTITAPKDSLAVLVPTKATNIAQEPTSAPVVASDEQQATTEEPLSTDDAETAAITEEDVDFPEKPLEEEQVEEVADARAGADVYGRAW